MLKSKRNFNFRAFDLAQYRKTMCVVGIIQSNYIPWRGYFDLMAACDVFILYDEMQYTKRDWRNRNKIKTANGLQWLTVPVKVKGNFHQKISEVKINGVEWRKKHWKSIEMNYQKSTYFNEISELISPVYLQDTFVSLSDLNYALIKKISKYLNISTKIKQSSEFSLPGEKSETLASICDQLGAKTYISGPSAKRYLDEQAFNNLNIEVSWFDYDGYQDYLQLWGRFEPSVSILDLLFNCGPTSRQYIKN
jgi:hypothetical protein